MDIIQLIDDDIVQEIALSAKHLDDIIDISLVSSAINNRFKKDNLIDLVAQHLKISRPIINNWTANVDGKNVHISRWEELLRENSKIHATKYAHAQSTDDYPHIRTVIQNVLRENRYIDTYREHIRVYHYGYASDIHVIDQLTILIT